MKILPRPGTVTGSTYFISHSVAKATTVVVGTSSKVWPPPKHSPMTLSSHNLTAVVSLRPSSPRRRSPRHR
jgi:hypothetical protein